MNNDIRHRVLFGRAKVDDDDSGPGALGYEGQGHSFKPDPWVAFMGRVARFFDMNVKNAK